MESLRATHIKSLNEVINECDGNNDRCEDWRWQGDNGERSHDLRDVDNSLSRGKTKNSILKMWQTEFVGSWEGGCEYFVVLLRFHCGEKAGFWRVLTFVIMLLSFLRKSENKEMNYVRLELPRLQYDFVFLTRESFDWNSSSFPLSIFLRRTRSYSSFTLGHLLEPRAKTSEITKRASS